MRKLQVVDIKDLRAYERERDAVRAEVIAMKRRRRVALGDLVSIVFENAATMRFQIQEMARAERMMRDEQIAHEIDVYNQLIPAEGELSGTLFVEIDDPEALRHWLPRLVGIDDHVAIAARGDEIRGRPEDTERQTRDDVATTVHYLKFAFTPEQQRAFAVGPARLVIDHPAYVADVTLSDEQRAELVGDFAA